MEKNENILKITFGPVDLKKTAVTDLYEPLKGKLKVVGYFEKGMFDNVKKGTMFCITDPRIGFDIPFIVKNIKVEAKVDEVVRKNLKIILYHFHLIQKKWWKIFYQNQIKVIGLKLNS